MPPLRSYRDLLAWRRAMELATAVHELCKRLPASEIYGLAAQLRRAAVSVPANIAEGYGRATGRDLANFLSVARGSLLETETLLELSARFGYLSDSDIAPALSCSDEVSRLLRAFRRSVLDAQDSTAGPLRRPRAARDQRRPLDSDSDSRLRPRTQD